MPEFDPSKSYKGEYFKMLIKNAQLHKEIYEHAKKYTANRRKDVRKIVNRKTMAELKRDECCPYKSCSKIYASELSLSLHI